MYSIESDRERDCHMLCSCKISCVKVGGQSPESIRHGKRYGKIQSNGKINTNKHSVGI